MPGTSIDRERATSFRALFEDESSFRAWYEEALPRVFGYLVDRCSHSSLAEELTQETFVEAVRHRATFDGRSDPMTWVVGIARHKLVDHFRRRSRDERRHLRLVSDPGLEPGADDVERTEIREDTLRALERLPVMQRAAMVLHYAAMVLHYLDDLPVPEVCTALGKSEHAVESLLARGRRRLREAMGDEGASASAGREGARNEIRPGEGASDA